MNFIAEELEKISKNLDVFVLYKEEPNVELTIPFSGKNGINFNNNLIIGENFIENNLIALEKDKIVGINWYSKEQEGLLERDKLIINKKIELYNNLITNLKHKYSYDKKFVIYDPSNISLAKVPFNVKSLDDLKKEDNFEHYLEIFKYAINLSVIKAKEIVDDEAKEYMDSNDSSTLDEIKAIKEIIDESVACIDYTDIKTPEELILNCWPVILTPNPFIVNV